MNATSKPECDEIDPATAGEEKPSIDDSSFYEAYATFARNLRTWLLAYGVGGPVIFLTNEGAGKRLMTSGHADDVAVFFLSGVALQVLQAVLYKYTMWFLYAGELDPNFKSSGRYRVSNWVSTSASIEISLDVLTIAFFGVATYRVFRATLF